MNIKTKATLLLIAFVVLTTINGIYQCKQANKYRDMYEVQLSNQKAYEQNAVNNPKKQKEYQFTTDQLKASTDTFTQVIVQVQKERGIKDKQLQQVQYQISSAQKTDTVVFHDTIFKDSVSIDTMICDSPWYQLDLSLKYPDTIVAQPQFHSERYVLISAQKETIKPRSKWWIIRLFQKKHTVINVDIEERNPYIDIEKQKYIQIIK